MATLPFGQRVIVYRNRTRGGWSVAEYRSTRSRGAVIANLSGGPYAGIVLRDAMCVVLESRRQAVLAAAARGEKKREVMAWVVGTLCEAAPDSRLPAVTIDIDVLRHASFVTPDGAPVAGADYVTFDAGKPVARGGLR